MSLKVVLVDDDPVVNFLHKRMLENSQLTNSPISFSNGEDVLEYLHSHHTVGEQYIIFLDINLPVMSGWELLDAINTQPYSNAVIVIVVTSSIDIVEHERAKEYKQVVGFFEKPLETESIEKIKKYLL